MTQNQKENSNYPTKCHCCENYDNERDTCKQGNTTCDTDFSKCSDYLVKEKLVMF